MNLLLLASAVIPTVVLMWLFLTSDEFPEPRSVLLVSFTLGGLLSPVLLLVFHLLEPLTNNIVITNPYVAGTTAAFFVAAIPEETLKFLVLRFYAIPHQEFDEPMDGVVYGVTVALGFATVENIFYVVGGGYEAALARSVTAVPCHAMLGSIMGYYAGRGAFLNRMARSLYLRALGMPILLHGLYDIGPLIWHKSQKMGIILPKWADFVFGVLFIVVLAFMVRIATKATGMLRARQRRGRPGFFFETAVPTPGAFPVSEAPSVFKDEELDEALDVVKFESPAASFTKVLAVLCISGSSGCLGGLIALLLMGRAGVFEVIILGALAGVFGAYAIRHLTHMNATISTELERPAFVSDDGRNRG